MSNIKNITIAFLGNGFFDSRVVNLSNSLVADGYNVKVISFDWFTEGKIEYTDTIKVFKLKKKGYSLTYYICFILILLFQLFKTKSHIYIAEDVFTLPFVWIVAKIKRAKVYYNSRELYPFLAGLRNKKKNQGIIAKIEKYFIGKTDLVMSTGEMDKEFIEEYYNLKDTLVLRNIPPYHKPEQKYNYRKELNLPKDAIVLLYQGVILEGRGIAIVLEVLPELENFHFVLLGEGVFRKHYEETANKLGIADRVHFMGMIPHSELLAYTAGADIGLTLIENISKSYYYALPNKLFEYIMAELPVLSSNLPQMENIVNNYMVGFVADPEDEAILKTTLRQIVENKELLSEIKQNCKIASKELNWQNEYKKFAEIIAKC